MYGGVESLALQNVEELITPKTVLERTGAFFAFLWIMCAFLPIDNNYRVFFFVLMILTAIFATFQKIFNPDLGDAGQSLVQAGSRTIMLYILLIFFEKEDVDVLSDQFPNNLDFTILNSYKDIEHWTILILIAAGLLLSRLDIQLLKQQKILDFFLLLSRGVSSASISIFIFYWLNFVSIEYPPDSIFLCAIITYVLAGLGPSRLGILQLTAGRALPVVPQSSRLEGLRDSLILGALIVLLFETLLDWLTEPNWIEIALVLIGLGIFIHVVALQRGLNPFPFIANQEQLKQRLDSVGVSLQQFQEDINVNSPNLTQRPVLSATEDIKLPGKAKESLSIAKDSIVFPLNETEKDTTLMVLGKQPSSEGISPKKKLPSRPQTFVIPHDEWNKLKEKSALVPTSFSDSALAKIGSSREKISEFIGSSMAQLKKGSFSIHDFSSVVPKMSRYGVRDTKEGTFVSLPGLRVIERGLMTYVKLPFLEVMDSKLGDLVALPFLRVLSTKHLDVVHTPLFSVIDTPKGSIVRIFGFTIREGTIDETEIQKTIQDKVNQIISARDQLGAPSESQQLALPAGSEDILEEESSPTVEIIEEIEAVEEEKPIIIDATIVKDTISEKQKFPICELCDDYITTVSTACPFCGREFHKDHWQAWIRKQGECPICREKIKVINP